MKCFSFIASLMLWFIASLQAKMISKVELTTIHHVVVTEGEITIVGDGVFQSRMITPKEVKDSNFVVRGQPSAAYSAQGYSVKFVLTPRKSLPLGKDANPEDKASLLAYNERVQKSWKRSLKLAQGLKKGDRVSFSIKGEEVVFRNGSLVSVTGRGSIPVQKEKKTE